MNAIAQTMKDFGPVKLAAGGMVLLVLMGFFAYLASGAGGPTMSSLYSGLTLEDSNRVVAELDAMNVPYELRAGGTQVMVPGDEMMRIRVQMAGKQIPSSGSLVGFEVFDKENALGTSSFVHNVNYIRALEGELGRTVSAMEGIGSARVHLVIPRRELFNREQVPPTASVSITLASGKDLGKMQISAIRHLVATAVPGLEASRITIVDNKGKLLARGNADEEDPGSLAEDAQDYRSAYEIRTKKAIEALLEQSIGLGKVQTEVTADIDFDRTETTSETYDPDGQVARSVQTIEEKENSQEKGESDNTSVANNLPDAQATGGSNVSNTNNQRTDETTNFEISKTIKKQIQQVGTIKRLSVAVVVDGTYGTDKDGKRLYTPRTAAELKTMEELVKTAIGFDEKRGDSVRVVNMQFVSFAEEPPAETVMDWIKRDLNSILETVLFGVVAILAILLVIRPLINHILEVSSAAQESESDEYSGAGGGHGMLGGPGIAGHLTDQRSGGMLSDGEEVHDALGALLGPEDENGMVNVAQIRGKVKSSSIRRIQQLVESHPEETVGVIRAWMSKE
jgi:flagellar M-ring protein FliF